MGQGHGIVNYFSSSNFKLSAKYTNLLSTKDEIASWVAEVDSADPAKKVEMMRSTFYASDFRPFWDNDPASDSYRDLVFKLFEEIAGRSYDVRFEAEGAANRNIKSPYPYSTRAKNPISENLMGVAGILNLLPVNPVAKILDVGCGWANGSLTLARSGYDVTCVDIDPSCGEIVDFWKSRLLIDERIRFVESSFDDLEGAFNKTSKFDSIVFFKSFHHCGNPLKLLKSCYNLLEDGGFVVLAAEPITPNYYVPWGIRCDGTSVYAIAKHGWLELGYDKNYFSEFAEQAGFSLHSERSSREIPTLNGLVLKKS